MTQNWKSDAVATDCTSLATVVTANILMRQYGVDKWIKLLLSYYFSQYFFSLLPFFRAAKGTASGNVGVRRGGASHFFPLLSSPQRQERDDEAPCLRCGFRLNHLETQTGLEEMAPVQAPISLRSLSSLSSSTPTDYLPLAASPIHHLRLIFPRPFGKHSATCPCHSSWRIFLYISFNCLLK